MLWRGMRALLLFRSARISTFLAVVVVGWAVTLGGCDCDPRVECQSDAECLSVGKKVCYLLLCRECVSERDCAPGQVCSEQLACIARQSDGDIEKGVGDGEASDKTDGDAGVFDGEERSTGSDSSEPPDRLGFAPEELPRLDDSGSPDNATREPLVIIPDKTPEQRPEIRLPDNKNIPNNVRSGPCQVPGEKRECGLKMGVCKIGVQFCETTKVWSSCTGAVLPRNETCNRLDDNCDGKVDNVTPALLPNCPSQQGKCKGAKKRCVNGRILSCTATDYRKVYPEFQTNESKCDGKDENCDGITDNLPTTALPLCPKNKGVCKSVRQTCVNGTLIACTEATYRKVSTYQASESKCDGLDNDCDGLVDEGLGNCVTTFAGRGGTCSGNCQRNGKALEAVLGSVLQTAPDDKGNLFFIDYTKNSHLVRKVTLSGMVEQVAGRTTGCSPYSPSIHYFTGSCYADGSVSSARFYYPRSILWVSGLGLFVSELYGHRIRRILGGEVTTIAGQKPKKVGSRWLNQLGYSVNGAAASSRLNYPWGMVMRGKELLFADSSNHVIRSLAEEKVNVAAGYYAPSGSISKAIFGTTNGRGTKARFRQPTGMAIDPVGNVYIVDRGNRRLRKMAPDGTVTTVGPTWLDPIDVAVDAKGNLFLVEYKYNAIRKISASGKPLFSIGRISRTGSFKNGSFSQARFKAPYGVRLDGYGNLFVADHQNYRIRKVTFAASKACSAADKGKKQEFSTGTTAPYGIGICRKGLEICDGTFWRGVREEIKPWTEICNATDDDCDGIRNEGVKNCVGTLAGSGTSGNTLGKGTAASFGEPRGVVTNSKGDVFFVDRTNSVIRRVNRTTGEVSLFAGVPGQAKVLDSTSRLKANFGSLSGLAMDKADNLFVVDNGVSGGTPFIRTIQASGAVKTLSIPGLSFKQLWGIVVDPSGLLYVSDVARNQIYKINPTTLQVELTVGTGAVGSADGSASTASFTRPTGLALAANGDIYVSDSGNHRIRKIDVTGKVTTFVGSTSGFSDGTKTAAKFNIPLGLAWGPANLLFVADTGNHRIRVVNASGEVSTFAGTGKSGGVDGVKDRASFLSPFDLTFDATGVLLVSELRGFRIRTVQP